MVKICNYCSVQLEGPYGLSTDSEISSVAGVNELAKSPDGFFISHKRVVIHFHGYEWEQHLTMHLSPLGALALVRRLVDVLDGCSREGVDVPNLHSDLAYKAANVIIDGVGIPSKDLVALESFAASAVLDG